MNIITINIRRNLTCIYYFNQQMSVLERQVNSIINKNPILINSIDRITNQPLIRKNFHLPFNN